MAGMLKYVLILIVVIELSMVLFEVSEVPGTSLYNLVKAPIDWSSNNFLGSDIINGVLLTIGTGAAIVAGLYLVKNEWIVYAALGGVIITFGATLYQLFQFFENQGVFGDFGTYIAMMGLMGLVIVYITTVLDFTRGKD